MRKKRKMLWKARTRIEVRSHLRCRRCHTVRVFPLETLVSAFEFGFSEGGKSALSAMLKDGRVLLELCQRMLASELVFLESLRD